MSHAERGDVVDLIQPDEDDILLYSFAPLDQRPTLTNAVRPTAASAVTPPPSSEPRAVEEVVTAKPDPLDDLDLIGTFVKADSLLLDPIDTPQPRIDLHRGDDTAKVPNQLAITPSKGVVGRGVPSVSAGAEPQQGGKTVTVLPSKHIAEQKSRPPFRVPGGRPSRTRAMGAGCDDELLGLQVPLAASSGVAGTSGIAGRSSGRDSPDWCDICCDRDCF